MTYRELLQSREVRGALGLLLAVAMVAGAIRLWRSSTWDSGLDFYPLWVVGQAAGESDGGSIYDPAEQRRIGEEALAAAHGDREAGRLFIAAEAWEQGIAVDETPLVYTAFGAPATDDYETDFQRYRRLVLLLTLICLPVLARTVGLDALQTMAVSALFMAGFGPLHADLRLLGVQQVALAMLALYFGIRMWGDPPFDDLLGGLTLAMACLFQPMLAPAVALLTVYWLIDRRWQTALGHGVGALIGVGLAGLATWFHFGGIGGWSEWLQAQSGPWSHVLRAGEPNLSFAAELSERSVLEISGYLMVAVLVVALAVLAVRRRKPATVEGSFSGVSGPAADRDLLVLALGLLAFLLGADVVRRSDFLLAVPAFFVAASGASAGSRSWWRWALLALAFLPHAAEPGLRRLISTGPGAFTLELGASVLILLILLLTDRSLGRTGAARRVDSAAS